MKQAIIIFGTITGGIEVIYGPFKNREAAEEYAEQTLLTVGHEIAFLVEPE